MNIYIDESGSINNKANIHSPYFVIALVHVKDRDRLLRAFKRFVSSNLNRLKELDQDRVNEKGVVIREGGKMFRGDKFKELKGSQFDPDMKSRFVEFFGRKPYFEVFYICIDNTRISDRFCENTARCFNYTLKLALHYFIVKGLLPDEECILQIDERNEKTESRHFLENYLNTELVLSGECSGPFSAAYYDSADNRFVQIADVFANLYYSHLHDDGYRKEINWLKERGILRYVFEFPYVKK